MSEFWSKYEKPKVLEDTDYENDDKQADRLSKINVGRIEGDI